MNREELLKSKEYWTEEIQVQLFNIIENFLIENEMSRIEFAEKLGVTKSYVTQILNGDFDHRISKFVELALSVGKVPIIKFMDIDEVLKLDKITGQNPADISQSSFIYKNIDDIIMTVNEGNNK